jgi:hypothetical protein
MTSIYSSRLLCVYTDDGIGSGGWQLRSDAADLLGVARLEPLWALLLVADASESAPGDANILLGDVKSSLGDAKSSLGDTTSSLGDVKSSLGDTTSSLGDGKSSLGDTTSLLGDAYSSLGDANISLGGANIQRWIGSKTSTTRCPTPRARTPSPACCARCCSAANLWGLHRCASPLSLQSLSLPRERARERMDLARQQLGGVHKRQGPFSPPPVSHLPPESATLSSLYGAARKLHSVHSASR